MKLSVLSPDDGGGGIATFYAQFNSSNVDELKIEVISADPFRQRNLEFPVWQTLPFILQQMLAAAEAGFAEALVEPCGILEVCDWPLGFVPAVIGQRVPYIVQCHGSLGQLAEHDPQVGGELAETFVQLIEPLLLRSAHRIQTYSVANQRFWERTTGRRIDMIRPAFSLPILPSIESIDPVGRVFGRLQRWKGPHILCDALRLLEGLAPQVEWFGRAKPWASGEWPADRRLAAVFPDIWGVNLHHRPAIPREHVFTLQSSALFNVVPSTWDVFNFTAVESMAAARPTIVSTGAGASELIIDGENGFTFENGNAEALADVIDRVLSMSESRRREIGAEGRKTIQIELDPARIGEQRVAAYEEAIRSFHESPPEKPHEWLVRMLTPQPSAGPDYNSFLDPVPLRAMGKHIARRIVNKVRSITPR